MQLFYKIFLALFVVFIGINIYGVNWSLGFMDEENSKFIFSIAASLIGIIVIYIMSTWQKVGAKK